MSTRRNTLVSVVLIAASMAIGIVIASRLNMAPASSAQTFDAAANSTPPQGPIHSSTFRDIADAQTAMVVNIEITSRQNSPVRDFFGFGGGDDFFRRFFGQPEPPEPQQPQERQSAGTGFVIDESGLILTNNHVVQDATEIAIHFFGDEDDVTYDAIVLGRDPITDSALLQLTELPEEELPVAVLGDSSLMAPGDWVMAIGNPFGYGHTVTVGVISAIGRPFTAIQGRAQEVLQTDAAINPGNSGGPLLNIRGEVIGINTAIIGGNRAANTGIGFAFPINTVRELIPELRSGKVTRGRIGVGIMPVPADSYEDLGLTERTGTIVSAVEDGGPAARAGIEPGDVIVRYNGERVDSPAALQSRVVGTAPGTSVPLTVLRDGEELTLDVTVEELDLGLEANASADSLPETVSEGFGMRLQDLSPQVRERLRIPDDTEGAVVTSVEAGGPAARGGVRDGDVILRVNRVDVGSATEAARQLAAVEAGRTAFLLVQRQSSRIFLQVPRE